MDFAADGKIYFYNFAFFIAVALPQQHIEVKL